MAFPFLLLCKRSSLLCVLSSLLFLVNPSESFRVSGAVELRNKTNTNNPAASSTLFRVTTAAMPTKRKLPPNLFLPLDSSTSADEAPKQNDDEVSWKDRLLKVSNIASILCVIDCTVLPIVTVLMPLLGLAAFTPAQMEWLHDFGHQVALYFVIPVGGTAALLNYSSHKKWKLSAPAALGLALIYLANGHGGPILGLLPHNLAHSLHCGTALHRGFNVAGCALLLGSNYKSHQATHTHGDCCNHNH